MKTRPILFSTNMVQSILAGNKTMTRRTIKSKYLERGSTPFHTIKKCPYGQIGDQLWVRETWTWEGDTGWRDLMPLGSFYYKADFEENEGPTKWKPSIFMPREASRITLEVTDVRVERLMDISEEDAMVEGVDLYSNRASIMVNQETAEYENCLIKNSTAITLFSELWEKINGRESLEANPWVWVIKFKRVKP